MSEASSPVLSSRIDKDKCFDASASSAWGFPRIFSKSPWSAEEMVEALATDEGPVEALATEEGPVEAVLEAACIKAAPIGSAFVTDTKNSSMGSPFMAQSDF